AAHRGFRSLPARNAQCVAASRRNAYTTVPHGHAHAIRVCIGDEPSTHVFDTRERRAHLERAARRIAMRAHVDIHTATIETNRFRLIPDQHSRPTNTHGHAVRALRSQRAARGHVDLIAGL